MSESAPGPSQAPPQELPAVYKVPTPRAEYIHATELPAVQQQAREALSEIGIVRHEHTQWTKGKTLTEFLRTAEDYRQQVLPGATPEQNDYAQNMAEAMQRYASTVRNDIKQRLLAEGNTPEELTDNNIDRYVAFRLEKFNALVQDDTEILAEVKDYFINRINHAVNYQGLPVSVEQLQQRLQGVALVYNDPLNEGMKAGRYMSQSGVIQISSELNVDDFIHIAVHELVHAASGVRHTKALESLLGSKQKRIGLENTHSKTWLNEGVTEILAYVLTTNKVGLQLDFGSKEKPLIDVTTAAGQNILAGMVRTLEDAVESSSEYINYSTVAVRMLTQIPAYTLMRAVFAQNNDPYEVDQMAGSHAERDLQRALKVAGGVEMLKKMRIVEQAYKNNNLALASSVADEVAANPASRLQRFKNKRSANAHTKNYQAQIQRAKKAANV